MRVFLFKLLSTFFASLVARLSFFVELCRSRASPLFDNLQRRLTKLLLRIMSSFATHNSTNLDSIRLSNAVKICRFLSFLGAKFVEKDWRIIIRQSFLINFDNIQHHSTKFFCRMRLNFVDLGRKILGKNAVEKDRRLLAIAVGFCRKIFSFFVKKCKKILMKNVVVISTTFSNNIFIYVSTSFDKPGARLFVN